MRTIREVLRLRWEAGLSQREIGISCRLGRSAVRDHLLLAEAARLSWPLPEGVDEEALERLLRPNKWMTATRIRPRSHARRQRTEKSASSSAKACRPVSSRVIRTSSSTRR